MRSWHSNIQLHHPLFVPVLLVITILAVYYPAIFSGIHTIDDPGIFSLYSASSSLSQILQPGNGYYYRPLVEFSYWIDNLLWGMEPVTMHLESILLHCANSLLVFMLACKISSDPKKLPLIPLFAALLFALHPANVEAVAWIAGRTDPLLSLFVLSASFFLLRWLDEPRWQNMVATLVLFGAALLTKETAIAFGAVVVLLTIAWPGIATVRQRITAIGIMLVPALFLVVLAFAFRSGTSGLNRFITSTDLKLGQGIWDALIAFGFYARKLIVPIPLNFAITEVHPIYGLLGVVILPVLWWVFRKYRKAGILFISAVFFILPALLIAVKQIAWTPIAERYLYLPSAFYAIGLSVLIQSSSEKFRRPVVLVALLVLTSFACISLQRTILWGNKLAFFQDAVAKSPGFGSVYYSLGGELIKKGDIDRAAEAFATADLLNKRDSMRYSIKASIMGTMIARGENNEAISFFYQLFKEKKAAPADFLELLYKAGNNKMNELSGNAKVLMAVDLLETLDLLNQKRNDPFWLYRSGQMSLVIGDKVKATDFFSRSYIAAPPDAHYRGAAGIYLRKLGCAQ